MDWEEKQGGGMGMVTCHEGDCCACEEGGSLGVAGERSKSACPIRQRAVR